jgi:hypothetical protein
MIDFITTFLTEQGCLNREAIQKLEYLLHQHLPMQLNTRKEIGLWILKNSDKDSEYKI